MANWIATHAPDLLDFDDPREVTWNVAAEYKRLKDLFDRTCFEAFRYAEDHGLDLEDIEMIRTKDGFAFRVIGDAQ